MNLAQIYTKDKSANTDPNILYSFKIWNDTILNLTFNKAEDTFLFKL